MKFLFQMLRQHSIRGFLQRMAYLSWGHGKFVIGDFRELILPGGFLSSIQVIIILERCLTFSSVSVLDNGAKIDLTNWLILKDNFFLQLTNFEG